ncbi:hypothetical protein AAC387_Pa02g0711 [Persea americana]
MSSCNTKMAKALWMWWCLFLCSSAFLSSSEAKPTIPQPQELKSFKILKTKDSARGCSYTVSIKTSCSSRSTTRDMVSLAFGDAYGNEVYVPRLDDPSTGTFERCSTDTFKITGPCSYETCYLYLLRSGSDGWKPESVKINGPYSKGITFYYKTFLPNGVWYGFNLCNKGSSTMKGDPNSISQM